MRARGLPRTPHPLVAQAAGTFQVVNGRGVVYGWALRGGAAAATLDLFDGPASNGLPIGSWAAAVLGADSLWCGDDGIYFDNGLTVVTTGGPITGAIYYVAQTRIDEFFIDQESRAAPIGGYTQQWPESALLENGYR